MAKVALLKFSKNGKFTSEIVDGNFSEHITKPGLYAVIGLNEVLKPEDETLKLMDEVDEEETEQ